MTRYLGSDELYALRQIPLPAVLRACGARSDRYDRKKWHTIQGSLSVAGLQELESQLRWWRRHRPRHAS